MILRVARRALSQFRGEEGEEEGEEDGEGGWVKVRGAAKGRNEEDEEEEEGARKHGGEGRHGSDNGEKGGASEGPWGVRMARIQPLFWSL